MPKIHAIARQKRDEHDPLTFPQPVQEKFADCDAQPLLGNQKEEN
jgi:hypothetical protein